MADFGKQLADLMLGPKPEEKPSAPPAIPARQSSVPITGEIKPYDPTFREIAASKLQRGMEALGMDRYKARQRAETLMGGESSNLPMGFGLADIVPFLGTALQTQEAARGLEAAGEAAKQGDYIGAGVEGVFGALGMIPGATSTAKTVRAMRAKAAADDAARSELKDILGIQAKPKAPEQKMMMGVYRGYTGDLADDPSLSATPQRRVAEYYANRRAAERGGDPHVEMLMVDPFAGRQYGLSIPIDKYNREITVTKARELKPGDVKARTQLKKKGGKVSMTDNIDAMRLELAAGGYVDPDPVGDNLKSLLGMAKGGGGLKEKLKEKIKEAVKPAFTQKQLESTAEKMADKIKAENPKLSDAEAMKKGMRQAEQKLKWEKVEKPALEKTYGALEKAKFSASLPERQRNVPEVVEKRIQETRDFLAQPVEPWQPPRKELQAFDRERIKDALEGFPGVEQTRFPRYQPARADLSHVEEVYNDPVNRELIKGQITRGLPLGGETFYASLYPLKLAALERGIPEEKFNQFIYSVAPASARNSIMNEMAVGQFLRDMRARGLPLDEETVTREMAKFREQYGTGLPLMPVHREGVKNVLEGNQDLRELLKADIPTNYKIPTYGTQKAGDFGQSMVLDVHESAGQTRGSRFHPYFTEQGGFGPTEYGLAESKMLDIAGELGLPGGMAQAGRWFGGGELTGLKSPRGDALDLLERQTAYTLQGLGINPTPRNVRNYLLDMIDTGEGVLMPWFKKEGMPDVRTEKKKGGAVKKKHKVKITDNKDAQMLASLIR